MPKIRPATPEELEIREKAEILARIVRKYGSKNRPAANQSVSQRVSQAKLPPGARTRMVIEPPDDFGER